MKQVSPYQLSNRERQITEALYLLREGSVADILGAIPEPPGYSAVRTTMNILVRKGSLAYRKEGRKYLYFPVISQEKARQSAVKHLLRIYFGGSVQHAIFGLLKADKRQLTETDHKKLVELIQKARRK